jgi:hypothetical protein
MWLGDYGTDGESRRYLTCHQLGLAMGHHPTTELNWSACLETPANLFFLEKTYSMYEQQRAPFYTAPDITR